LTAFGEIWYGDTYWPSTGDRPLKFRIFETPKMAAVAIMKIKNIAITHQRINRYHKIWQDDAKKGLLTIQIVKKFEFQISKMVEGHHFGNR